MAKQIAMPRLEARWTYDLADHVQALAWSPDGTLVAAASVSGPIRILDGNTGAERFAWSGHGFGTSALSWSSNGKVLVSAGQDGKLRFWDMKAGTERQAVAAGSAWAEGAAFSPKGSVVVSTAGKKIKLWESDGTLIRDYPDFGSTVLGMDWDPRGKQFAVAGYGGVIIYSIGDEQPIQRYEWKGSLLSLAYSPDGQMLAGGGQDSTVHFWYVKSGNDLEMSGYPTKVKEISWSADSRFLATGGGEIAVVWDCSGKGPAGSKPLMIDHHEAILSAVRFQTRGPIVATGCEGGLVALTYPTGGTKCLAKATLGEPVASLAWAPSDQRLAVGGSRGSVVMYAV